MFYSNNTISYNQYRYLENAYKAFVFFSDRSIEATLARFDAFLDRYSAKDEFTPILSLFRLNLPHCIEYGKVHFDLPSWKEKLLDLGPIIMHHACHLSKVEQHLGRVATTREELDTWLATAHYQRALENTELARLAHIYDLGEPSFNFLLDHINKETFVPHADLPEIAIDVKAEAQKYHSVEHTEQGQEALRLKSTVDNGRLGHFGKGFDVFNDFFLVQVPKDDIRYKIFYAAISEDCCYSNPISAGIYAIIEAKAGKALDPTNIDWVNLERDGHQIKAIYHFLSLVDDVLITNSWIFDLKTDIYNSCTEILLSTLSQQMPELTLILESCFIRDSHEGQRHLVYSPRYKSAELAESESELRKSGFCLEDYTAPRLFNFSNIEQISKIKELGKEYINSLKSKNMLLSWAVLKECSSVAEIKKLHAEILALQESDSIRFKAIFNLASAMQASEESGYRALAQLPTDILEFLVSVNLPKYNLKLEVLMQDATTALDVERNFIKYVAQATSQNGGTTEIVEAAPAEIIDVLAQCQYLPLVLRYIKLQDIVGLNIELLDLILSDQAVYLYSNGVDYHELLEPVDALSLRRDMFLSSLRLMIREENHVQDLSVGLVEAISKFTESQLDFFDKNADDLAKSLSLMEFVAKNPEADEMVPQRRLVEINLSEFQIVEEGMLQDIPEDKFSALADFPLEMMIRSGFITIEALLSYKASVINALVRSYPFSFHIWKSFSPIEILECRDPEFVLEILRRAEVKLTPKEAFSSSRKFIGANCVELARISDIAKLKIISSLAWKFTEIGLDKQLGKYLLELPIEVIQSLDCDLVKLFVDKQHSIEDIIRASTSKSDLYSRLLVEYVDKFEGTSEFSDKIHTLTYEVLEILSWVAVRGKDSKFTLPFLLKLDESQIAPMIGCDFTCEEFEN